MSKFKIYQDFDRSILANGYDYSLPKDSIKKLDGIPFVEIKDPFPNIQLSPDQRAALEDIIHWVIHPVFEDRILTVGGWAGTGKSVVINYVQSYLRHIYIPCAVTSITGKAVLTLKSKGIYSARTVHSLLYHVDEFAKQQGELKFIKNGWLDEYIIIIDEAQTLTEKSVLDFLSFPHVRLILVGDHGQLEPIGGSSHYMKDPKIKLDKVHRQALNSDILKIAHAVRQGKMPSFGETQEVKIAPKSLFDKELEKPDIGQIIVGFNSTRHKINSKIRSIRGFHGDYPKVGESVINLNNNEFLGIYNGQVFEVLDSHRINSDLIQLELDSDGQRYSLKAIAEQFGSNKLDYSLGQKFLRKGFSQVCFLDYSYAITCYKALGSQWDRGAILEECHPDWDKRRVIYTAMTRFIKYFSYFK